MAKTTGIMQQRSDEPLSDEESVTLAAGYVGRMWDAFLRAFARSGKGGYGPSAIRFGRDWYEYDYEEVKEALLESGADLYGDYCGSRVLDVRPVLERVISFEEGYSYGLLYCLAPSWPWGRSALVRRIGLAMGNSTGPMVTRLQPPTRARSRRANDISFRLNMQRAQRLVICVTQSGLAVALS